MAFVTLQIPDAPDVVFTCVLDNAAYDLRLHWNGRDQAWYLFLGKQNTEYVFKTKITTNSDLLISLNLSQLPQAIYPQKERWALVQAKNLLESHRAEYDALVQAMIQRLPVADCCRIIQEKQHS